MVNDRQAMSSGLFTCTVGDRYRSRIFVVSPVRYV